MADPALPVLMENMTVEDVRAALARGATVLVPLGVTEQHGYHLPLSTDMHNAMQVARRVAERTNAIVAPTLAYSYSGGGLPGTINVAPQVMALMVGEIAAGLLAQGFRTIVLVLGHAGTENMAAIKDLVSLFLARHPELPDAAIALAPVWEFSPTWMAAFADHDFHAGYIETSLMLHWAPELVRLDRLTEDPPELAAHLRAHQDNYQKIDRPIDDPHVAARVTQRPDIKVGVMGYPRKATAAVGKQVCDECVAGIVDLVRRLEAREVRR